MVQTRKRAYRSPEPEIEEHPLPEMRKRVHACWFGMVSFADFNTIMDAVTEDYGALC